MSKTEKQHYVPQFYLSYFTENNLLQILDVENNRLCNPKGPGGVGYKPYYYARETGVPDEMSQEVESFLEQYENLIASKIPNVIKKIKERKEIKRNDKYLLAVLMSMLWLRSPNMRKQLNKMQEKAVKKMMSFSAMEGVDEQKFNLNDNEKKELVEMIKNEDYNLAFDNIQHIQFITEKLGVNSPGFANLFFGQKWKIYIAKGDNLFITSDSPVVELFPKNTGFYGPSFLDRPKYFPLTPRILIELTYPKGSDKVKRKDIYKEDDEEVLLYNLLIAGHASSFAYSKEKKFLEEIKDPGMIVYKFREKFNHLS